MDNRQRIMQEALRLFAAQGYEAVGVQEIVLAAGLTKPSLYHHFGSKLGLLKALLEDGGLELLTRVRAAAAYQGDLPLTLYRVVGAYFDFAREQPDFYRLQLGLWLAPSESEALQVVRPWNEGQQNICEELFQAAASDHGNMKGRHRLYAALFLGMINTLIGVSLNGYLELGNELVFKATHQFMHGIYS